MMKGFHRVFFCAVLYLLISISGQDKHCTDYYISSAGRNCKYCPPGTYKHQDCEKDGESAICKGCPVHHYETHCNQALKCAPCSPNCKWRYTYKVKNCSLYHDLVCECEEGRYWKKETETDGVCLRHSECPAGQGLEIPGNNWNNTKCLTCVEGRTFSTEKSLKPCSNCTLCDRYKKTCTEWSDAECDSNTTPGKSLAGNPKDASEPTEGRRSIIQTTVVVVLVFSFGVIIGLAIWCNRHVIVKRLCRRREPDNEDEDDDLRKPLQVQHAVGSPMANKSSSSLPRHSVDTNLESGTANDSQNSHSEEEMDTNLDSLNDVELGIDEHSKGAENYLADISPDITHDQNNLVAQETVQGNI